MSDQQRITQLEARLAQAETRIAQLEKRLHAPWNPAPTVPSFPEPPYKITCGTAHPAVDTQAQNNFQDRPFEVTDEMVDEAMQQEQKP